MTALIVAFAGVAVVWATGLAYGGVDRRCRWERRHKRRYQGSHRAAATPKPWARRSRTL